MSVEWLWLYTTVNSTAKDADRPSCSEALPEGSTGALEPLGELVGLAGSTNFVIATQLLQLQ